MPVPGDHVGPYEIVASLGAGGMGEVYRARDARLGRDVALKTLPASMAADPDRRERFRREARAVAALNHPNIVTIYSVEEADGVDFLTMELIDGVPLTDRIPSSGMPEHDVATLGGQIADALAAAHDKDIVHRDLKPANVMITRDGRVKILDFGLAKALGSETPGTDDLETVAATDAGMILGTVPYMSPEQVEGRAVDHRSDLFSLGTMLYEMATGARPFQGGSSAALLSSILRDTPPPVSDVRQHLDTALARIISRCLEKDRERRIQTARDVRNELDSNRRTGAQAAPPRSGLRSAASPHQHAIVVLPFANLSADPENEFFSDGLTEEIIADLSRVKALRVISRTSSMQLKGTKKDVRTLGRELGVGYVIEGSVRKAGSSLRITAQLIDAASDANLWSDKYQGTMDDVFEVQERVAREVVGALNVTLTSDEHARLAERPIADPRAFELFLRARAELYRYRVDAGVALIRQAIKIEGETPILRGILTLSKVLLVRTGVNRDPALLAETEREALALQTALPSLSHSILGSIAYERGDLPGSVRHCRKALELDPNDADAPVYLCVSAFGGGQDELARVTAERFLAADPLSPMAWMSQGARHWFIGRAADGLESLERGVELDPANLIVLWTLGYNYAIAGQLDRARTTADRLGALAPDLPYARQLLALLDGLAGRPEAALARLAPIDTSHLDCHHRFHFAESYAAAGQIDRALDLLEEAVTGFYPPRYIAEYCRLLDPLRSSPRFAGILETARRNAAAFIV